VLFYRPSVLFYRPSVLFYRPSGCFSRTFGAVLTVEEFHAASCYFTASLFQTLKL
jgi:hypothetical protein